MAANLKFTLKRNNGTDYDELYPKTVIAQVTGLQDALDAKINTTARGAANGVASLDSSGKVPVGQLPAAVTGGMTFVSSISLATDKTADNLISAGLDNPGKYLVVSTGGNLVSGGLVALAFSSGGGDEQQTTLPVTLEAGDWIVVTGYTLIEPATLTVAIINNTYRDASSTETGIVTLSDGNGGVITGLAGNSVITEGNLAGLLLSGDQNGAVTTKIAVSGHTHSQYQPVDADLTAIAALTPTDGNIIVGNGSTWVAESGSTARTSLGLAIGTNVQAYDAGLQSIAGLATAADRMIYTTASDTYAVTTLTSFARTLLDDADASAARTTLGLTIGTNVQAYDADLAAIAALAVTDGNIIVGNGSTWVAESGATARTSLGLAIGTNVQAWDADLDAIAALSKSDGNFIVGNGTTWVAESGATARISLGVYSTTQVDDFFTNRPTILYNTTTGAASGSLILADVVAV